MIWNVKVPGYKHRIVDKLIPKFLIFSKNSTLHTLKLVDFVTLATVTPRTIKKIDISNEVCETFYSNE